MARFSRLEVLNTIVGTGLVPLFYRADVEVAKKIAEAVAAGGARVLEFTNRGDFAPLVFSELSQYLAKTNSNIILGAGSVMDAPTAAIYIANGANFVVSSILNPEVAVLCNRRKVAYSPGCGSASEIARAEELGVEIVKLFPGDSVGGPKFVKAILAPSPWTRIMPTGGVETTRQNISAWFKAGTAAVGIGSNLIRNDLIAAGDYAAITAKTAEVLSWIREVRAEIKG
jgi:2-dehydro-3-deoxyphosphogluconate aldolase/(4S)-4-hydroxy-2-oxoglutarate aldolase